MTKIQERIAASFSAQGLMVTIGATLALVSDGEVHIALPFSTALSQQHGYVHAIGRVQNAGKLLTVCTGEVRAFSDAGSAYKVIALMQATIVSARQ